MAGSFFTNKTNGLSITILHRSAAIQLWYLENKDQNSHAVRQYHGLINK